MKRLLIVAVVLLFASQAFAADSSVTQYLQAYESIDRKIVIIELDITAASDGTFTDYEVSDTRDIPYWQQGYYLAHAWTVNDHTTYPGASAITIEDKWAQQLVGTTAGDTLTTSAAADGVGYLVVDRASSQRPVTTKLVVKVADTGSAANIFKLFLLLRK